jgi:hypothetical protein
MQQTASENLLDWVRLAQSEFAEMPGLRLSMRQAQRLWNLDVHTTEVILDTLVSSHYLKRTPNNIYCKADVCY